MKITKDGFIWKVITLQQAFEIWNGKTLEIYQLRDNDVEGLIESLEDLNECIHHNIQIGIEVGRIEVEQAREIIENSGRGVITYSIADFEGRAEYLKKEFGDEYDESKFPIALERMVARHDMNDGITWVTVDFYLNEYCKK